MMIGDVLMSTVCIDIRESYHEELFVCVVTTSGAL